MLALTFYYNNAQTLLATVYGIVMTFGCVGIRVKLDKIREDVGNE